MDTSHGILIIIGLVTYVRSSSVVNLNTFMLPLLTIGIILYYKWRLTYWVKRRVPCIKSSATVRIVRGWSFTISTIHESLKRAYDEMKSQGHKYCGVYFFTTPIYVPIDLDHIKAILTRDFVHFQDRGFYNNDKADPLNATLLTMEGEKWKRLRLKFTPTFTAGKMKMMFSSLMSCADQMRLAVEKLEDKSIDIGEICACYTTDVIGSCVFGINCHSFDENAAEFRKHGRTLFKLSLWTVLKVIFSSMYKNFAKTLNVKIVQPEVSSFFLKVIEDTLRYREEMGIVRNDFLQLLMEMRREERDSLSVKEIAAQSFLFFAAGFETSSTTMTFCIYELCRNQDVQDKVRKEIMTALEENGGELTYENITEMKYLNQVIDETLRKHPSVPSIPRICTKDYKLPNDEGFIEKGTHVFVPLFAIHRDPEYYPDPERFDPDRFSEENKSKRHPYAYLPFGEGPRMCLGVRFGLLQMKIGLITLLRNYIFTPDTIVERPLMYDKYSVFLTTRDPVWVKVKRIRP